MSTNENPVILHIYDVPDANKYIQIFTNRYGIYHTGVEVMKTEYSFGGHPHDYTGIFKTPPKNIKTLSVSDTFQFKESKVIGKTTKDDEEIKQIVEQMGSEEFKGKNYHLIRKNCNHFSNAFCRKLCGKGIPAYLNKMVELIKEYPLIEEQIPQEFVTPKALENDVKQHEKQNKKKEATAQTKSSPNPDAGTKQNPKDATD